MPCRSLRRGLRTARLSWPPAHGIASSTITSWPRSPATRAASSPPGPAPTITIRRGRSAGGDHVRHRLLAARRGVVKAQRLTGGVDPVEAVGGADARPDLGLAALDDLAHDVRVGEVGAGHADQVDLALADRVPRRCHLVDLRGVQHGEVGVLARTMPAKSRCGTDAHAVDRDHLGQRRLVLDVAADDVDEVDQAAPASKRCSVCEPDAGVDPAVDGLVDHHPDADDEVGTDPLADRRQHVASRNGSRPSVAAPLVIAVVGERRQELVEQVPVGLDLDAVHPARLHPLGGVGVLADDALDVPVLGLLGDVAVGRLAHRRGRHDRQPVVLRPARAATEVGDLDHARRPVLVDLVGHAPDERHDLVLVGVQVAERRRAVLGDDRRAGGHRHADPALGLLDVVQPVAVARHAVHRVRRLVRRREHAIADRQVLQLVRLQQRIVGQRPRDHVLTQSLFATTPARRESRVAGMPCRRSNCRRLSKVHPDGTRGRRRDRPRRRRR